jgi:hypothetical protein
VVEARCVTKQVFCQLTTDIKEIPYKNEKPGLSTLDIALIKRLFPRAYACIAFPQAVGF